MVYFKQMIYIQLKKIYLVLIKILVRNLPIYYVYVGMCVCVCLSHIIESFLLFIFANTGQVRETSNPFHENVTCLFPKLMKIFKLYFIHTYTYCSFTLFQ